MRWPMLFFLFFASSWWAGPVGAAGLKVVEGVITTGIADRAPVDAVQTYPATVEKLYCFTELAGATGETTITHIWYFGDRESSRSILPVRGANWRTWSAKAMRPEWVGEWRVEVLDAEGNLLLKLPFTLTRR